jgi:hypothetical protein
MKRSEMSDAAISGSMARTWIFTRDCFPRKCGVAMTLGVMSRKVHQ